MYSIFEVPEDVADQFEPLGTRPKFWFEINNQNYLFKECRENTGEDWAEVVSSEICNLLNIPHANYELARHKGKNGVITEKFVPLKGRLILGNELLVSINPEYPKHKRYNISQYTISRVLAVLHPEVVKTPIGWKQIIGLEKAIDVFIGYLMLDVLIANQDRHHENWGLILTEDDEVHIAPTFDHASSLGRNERDEVRHERLTTRNSGRSINHYIERASSAFYSTNNTQRTLSTINAFMYSANKKKNSAKIWLEQVQELSLTDVESIFHNIPNNSITNIAADFALKIIELNRDRLINLNVN